MISPSHPTKKELPEQIIGEVMRFLRFRTIYVMLLIQTMKLKVLVYCFEIYFVNDDYFKVLLIFLFFILGLRNFTNGHLLNFREIITTRCLR